MTKRSFEKKYSFDLRQKEGQRLLERYPDRCPVIVENAEGSTLPELDKHKFLLPYETTVAQFMTILRQRMIISPETALFMFINNFLPRAGETIGNLYVKHKSEDNFLYLKISGENTFGKCNI